MKNKHKLFVLISIMMFAFLQQSCFKREFMEGKVEIISVTDSALHDSSIFVGHVYDNYYFNSTNALVPIQNAQVLIENAGGLTNTDSNGFFFIKIQPGTYTLKCQKEGNPWPQLIVELKNVSIKKNEKIQVDFYLGTTIE